MYCYSVQWGIICKQLYYGTVFQLFLLFVQSRIRSMFCEGMAFPSTEHFLTRNPIGTQMQPFLAGIEWIPARPFLLGACALLVPSAQICRERRDAECRLCLGSCSLACAFALLCALCAQFWFLFKFLVCCACPSEPLDDISLPFSSNGQMVHEICFIVPVLAVVSEHLVDEI